jgi:hypothetical protein
MLQYILFLPLPLSRFLGPLYFRLVPLEGLDMLLLRVDQPFEGFHALLLRANGHQGLFEPFVQILIRLPRLFKFFVFGVPIATGQKPTLASLIHTSAYLSLARHFSNRVKVWTRLHAHLAPPHMPQSAIGADDKEV